MLHLRDGEAPRRWGFLFVFLNLKKKIIIFCKQFSFPSPENDIKNTSSLSRSDDCAVKCESHTLNRQLLQSQQCGRDIDVFGPFSLLFVHLINFNQKKRRKEKSENTRRRKKWLNINHFLFRFIHMVWSMQFALASVTIFISACGAFLLLKFLYWKRLWDRERFSGRRWWSFLFKFWFLSCLL